MAVDVTLSSAAREHSISILEQIFRLLVHPTSGALSRRINEGTLTLTIAGGQITAINVDQVSTSW